MGELLVNNTKMTDECVLRRKEKEDRIKLFSAYPGTKKILFSKTVAPDNT